MNVAPLASIDPGSSVGGAVGGPANATFKEMLAAAVDTAANAVERADGKAGAVALGSGAIADASVARAKADVTLEIVSVAAARISGSLNALLQTQV